MTDSKREEIDLRKELYEITTNLELAKKKSKEIRRIICNSSDNREILIMKKELYTINFYIKKSKKRLKEIRQGLVNLKVCKNRRIYKMEEFV